jgi:photosystem II stability/assembly factor-like uncharacterized protein
MTCSIYSRLFVVGTILLSLALFSPVLTAQTSMRQKISKLPPSEERWALVIGISKYDDPELNPLYGQNDAKKIAADLEHYAGFLHDQIILLTDDQPEDHKPERERILWWLASVGNMSSPQGLVLIYFSGHGGEIGGKSYLLPQKAHQNNNPIYLEQNAIPVQLIWDTLKTAPAKQIIVLVDACRNNPYAAAGETANPMTQDFIDSFNYEKVNRDIVASITIFSTGLDQQSYQYHSKKMGFFSFVLDAALTGAAYDANGQLTLGTLIHYLQDSTPRLVKLHLPGREQKPFVKTNEGYKEDELVLAGNQPPPPPHPNPDVSAIPALPPPTPVPSVEITSASKPSAPSEEAAAPSPPLAAIAASGSAVGRLSGFGAWAIRDNTMLCTKDGGNSWQKVTGVPATVQFTSVFFVTPQLGWAVGYRGAIFHTEDGGGTWTTQNSGIRDSLLSVAFPTPRSGWIVGADGTILHTADGGKTWTRQSIDTDESLTSVEFVTDKLGWIATASAVGGAIFLTEDGGSTWKDPRKRKDKELNPYFSLESITFATTQLGWAVGDRGTILHTTDGGRRWRKQNSGTTSDLRAVVFADTLSGWAVGTRGTILHTGDGGSTWTVQHSGTEDFLKSVMFLSDQSGWVGGDLGTILHTEDGGRNWVAQTRGSKKGPTSVVFPRLNAGLR